MKIKTSELSGIALDWAVAKCEAKDGLWLRNPEFVNMRLKQGIRPSKYSSDWSQGGPIIEREKTIIWPDNGTNKESEGWEAELGNCWFTGPTPLIAAMRCYVASKLAAGGCGIASGNGEEVEIPDAILGVDNA